MHLKICNFNPDHSFVRFFSRGNNVLSTQSVQGTVSDGTDSMTCKNGRDPALVSLESSGPPTINAEFELQTTVKHMVPLGGHSSPICC